MGKQYVVVDEFTVRDATILVLNENRIFTAAKFPYVLISGKKYPYELTHNEKWITIKSDESFKGKTIEFIQ